MRCIDASDVERRIGFGITGALRLCQDIVERPSFVGHFAENVIRCAVENAVDRKDVVRGKRFL